MPLLRSAFIALSHNRPLRRFCEHSRIGARLSSRFIAGMDISDGLVQDLGHICRASGLAAELRADDVPLSPAARTVQVKLADAVACRPSIAETVTW